MIAGAVLGGFAEPCQLEWSTLPSSPPVGQPSPVEVSTLPDRKRLVAFRVLGALPRGEQLLDLYRLRFGSLRGYNLEGQRGGLLEMVRLLRGAGRTVEDRDLVEIGTGWHPLLPTVFYGLGARTILMTDVARHVRREFIEDVLDYCLEHAQEIAEIVGRDEVTLKARWSSLRPGRHDWRDVWKDRGISYRAPFDLTHHRLPADSVDIIFSNDCLGYIPKVTLAALVEESTRLLRPGGCVAHDVTVYDDRIIYDRSIPSWDFLSYSEKEWQRVGNPRLHFQNRCRPAEYAQIAAQHGLRMLYEERVMFDLDEAKSLDRSNLHPDYRDLPAEEILCRHYLFAAEKPSSGPATKAP